MEEISFSYTPFPKKDGLPAQATIPSGATLEKPAVELDPELTEVVLPSNFHPYTFKTLAVRTMKGIHQAKLAQAAKKESATMVAQVISSLLHGASAFDLTYQDFRWVMQYIRQQSFLKTPLKAIGICTNLEHMQRVRDGKVKKETLQNVTLIDKTVLQEKGLDVDTLELWVSEHPEMQRFGLGFQTVRDNLLMLDRAAEIKSEDDAEEYVWLAQRASFLRGYKVDEQGNTVPTTLDDRIKVVGEMSPDEVAALTEYIELACDYGVAESIKTKCTECGADIETDVSLSVHSFL